MFVVGGREVSSVNPPGLIQNVNLLSKNRRNLEIKCEAYLPNDTRVGFLETILM